MVTKQISWLAHLENAVPPRGYGNRLSMYLIALEAWRRGIHVKFYLLENPENKMLIRYTLSYKGKEHFFESSMGDKLTEEAFNICENKDATKKYLKEVGIPVPEGKRFKANVDDNDILRYAESLGYPLVIKPIDANAGRGVRANIKDRQSFFRSWTYVREQLNYKDILVEKFIQGEEYRVLVVNGKGVAAVKRIPANILGNGLNTIEELIKLKNKARKHNPNLSNRPINIDHEVTQKIQSIGYDLKSIPRSGERVYLRNNVSLDGDPIDVTEELSSEIYDFAVNAVKAIPGLNICGLDIIINKETNTKAILELNTKPMIGLHVFPVEGEAQDVVKPIVDYYFPETRNLGRSHLYFDFNAALAPIRNRIAQHVNVLPPPSTADVVGKKYIISIQNEAEIGYRNWIRLKALEKNLHGYVRKLSEDKIEVVVVGQDKHIVNEFKDVYLSDAKGSIITSFTEHEWNQPVKIGFEVQKQSLGEINNTLKKELKGIKDKNKKLIKEKGYILKEKSELNNQLQKIKRKVKKQGKENQKLNDQLILTKNERDQFQQSYDGILQSGSWRYTKILRVLFRIFKRVK